MGADFLNFAKMKLFLFFIGSSFATTCFKCKATAINENQVATTPPTALVPSIASAKTNCFGLTKDGVDQKFKGECEGGCYSLAYTLERYHGDSDRQVKSYEYYVERGCKRDRYALFYGKNPVAEQNSDWGAVTLTKDNFGNHGSITAKYTTQDVNGEKTAVVTAVAPAITTSASWQLKCRYENMMKNATMQANFPAATTRQRYCGPEENQCVSHVAQHDPKDYHFEANMKIQYAYRDCVKANATQIYHTLYYKSPLPGVRDMNVTTRTKYCDTNACNNDIAEWRSSGGSHLGVNLLFYALLGSLFALM